MNRKHLLLSMLSMVVVVGCIPTSYSHKFQPLGIYRHSTTRLAFPNRIGSFQRVYVTEYDQWKKNVAGHYQGSAGQPILATVFHYPATADAAEPTRDVFLSHFEQTVGNVTRIHPDAEIIHRGDITSTINGSELSGSHARFTLPDHPTIAGPVDSHLYLFAVGGWFLKFRFSHAVAITEDALPLEKVFIESVTWPTPN